MADLNLVERANKIITFRKYIREECRKKGLEYPSDAKISEYIADCGGDECVYDLNDFMGDYENKIGIFKDPFDDFKAEVSKHDWIKTTDEEMRDFITEQGYNVRGFLRCKIIGSYKPLEKDILVATLSKLTAPQLVQLWNKFIEESAVYGEDSYIYDLTKQDDVNLLRGGLKPSEWAKVVGFKCRYVSWHNLNDGRLLKYDDEGIKDVIVGYWSDIFPRLMVWSELYDTIGEDKDKIAYFDFIVRPIICKHLGYEYDPERGTFEEIKK